VVEEGVEVEVRVVVVMEEEDTIEVTVPRRVVEMEGGDTAAQDEVARVVVEEVVDGVEHRDRLLNIGCLTN
jgi:hypothetical protein